jgi:hypothetical protein
VLLSLAAALTSCFSHLFSHAADADSDLPPREVPRRHTQL